jgi:small subunit ribosomal protein S6
MNAVISGQAGVALLLDGDRVFSLRAGQSGEAVRRSPAEVRLLLGDARDLQFLERIELEEVRSRLERASEEVDALHLALILLDETLEADTRRIAAEELEERLGTEGIQRFVENVLHAHPLPRGADLAGAGSSCPKDAELSRYLLDRLGAHQGVINEVHFAWEKISEDLFEGKPDRAHARSTVVREGLFRDLVVLLASKDSLHAFLKRSLLNNQFRRIRNHRKILRAWVSSLRAEKDPKPSFVFDLRVSTVSKTARLAKSQKKAIAAAIGRCPQHMHRYELMFVVDPRVPDEEVVTMTQEYKNMITAGGSQITGEESWGRRKLAFPINKLNEGKYVLLYVGSDSGKTALPEVEHRMRQNDKILRYLTVRTDEDLKRAARRQPAVDSASGGIEEEGPAAESGTVEGEG